MTIKWIKNITKNKYNLQVNIYKLKVKICVYSTSTVESSLLDESDSL